MATHLSTLGELKAMALQDLKTFYLEFFDTQPPARASRDFLIGNISWAMQAQQRGQDPYRLRVQLISSAGKQAISSKIQYKPGTRLIREWKGVTHEVIVAAKGFRWQKRHYRSLSQIAREIPGARWSGPRFFGIKGQAPRPLTAESRGSS